MTSIFNNAPDFNNDRQRALNALHRLASWRADDRDTWLKVGMALHSVAAELLSDWDEWSKQSQTFKPGECRRQWRSFKQGGSITIATLIHMAQQDGGSDPPPPSEYSPKLSPPSPAKQPPPPANGRVYSTLDEAVQCTARAVGGTESQRWPYEGFDGAIIIWVVRFETPTGKKYRPVHKLSGGFKIGDPPGRLPLYRLRHLFGADRVFVCEGEKATDAAASIGLNATTSAHGAQAAAKTDWRPLTLKRTVVILPDNDDDGRKYRDSVARIINSFDAETIVKVVELPEVPPKGDFVEHLEARRAAGLTDDQIRAEIESLADKTQPIKPCATSTQVQPYQLFPFDVLPEPLRGFVSVSSTAIGCDASYVALPLLVGLASAVGNTHRIQVKRGWSEPSVLWCIIVGESGTLKSPAIDAALKPIRQRQDKAMDQFREQMEQYKRDMEIHKADKSDWLRNGRKNGEPEPLPPDKPTSGRCWCSDTTVEALARVLEDAGRGILVFRDELSGWLRGLDQYKRGRGADVAHYLEMHRAGHLLVDRKTGDRTTISVPHAAVSITGGIPPETLRRALGVENFENGLAARFLVAMPPPRTKRWCDTTVDMALEDRLKHVFDWLFALEAGMDEDGNQRPVLIPLSPAGQQAWIEFYNGFAVEQSSLTGALAAAASKLEGYAARLALVVHLVRCAAGELSLGEPIDEESVGVGVKLVRWFLHETRRVYAILSETDKDRKTRQLVELIRRNGGRISVREFQRCRSCSTAEEAKAELNTLAEVGHGTWSTAAPGPKGGRPSECLILNDSTDTDETPDSGSGSEVLSSSGLLGDGSEKLDGEFGVI